MDTLYSFHDSLLRNLPHKFVRSKYRDIRWKQRMLAIKGPRGAGKTTLMLQHITQGLGDDAAKALYVTADFHWFYTNSLFDTATTFYQDGGRYLYIDEVHKYPGWSKELKNIYDGYPDLQVVFSASSALDIYRGEADLSRRVMTYELSGLSFREYLGLTGKGNFPMLTLKEIFQNVREISSDIVGQIQPIPEFKDYLQFGYLPIINEVPQNEVAPRLNQIINTVLESDLAYIENYSPATAYKVKRLLGLLADSAPFKPNIASLSRKLNVSRDSVYSWFHHLQQARLINVLHKAGKGVSLLQKPDKIYLENTNLSYALKSRVDIGSVRESFVLNQLLNAGHEVEMPDNGDFLVDGKTVIEVGGRNKSEKQIKGTDGAVLALDNIETGHGNKIPLWLFGFLY